MNIITKARIVEVSLVAAGLGTGYIIGFHVAKKRAMKLLDELEETLNEAEDQSHRRQKTGDYATPEAAYEAMNQNLDAVMTEEVDYEAVRERGRRFVENLGYSDGVAGPLTEESDSEEEPEEDVRKTIFDQDVSADIDEDTEITVLKKILAQREADRAAGRPYIIEILEYMTDDDEFDKITVAYYDGDDTLADEREQIIPDVEGTVGRANLNHFGEGSDNKSIVYIRNERLHTDFEVVRDEESYSKIVLGIQQHEDARRGRRTKPQRDDDEG